MSDHDKPAIFLRKQADSEVDDDEEEWDDSKINAAYDKAVSSIKRKLTRKIQKELGLQDEDVREFLSDASSETDKKKNKKKQWKVGSSCRAVFSEDGDEYEAVIVKILDSRWCVVRFIGYENEEEVMMKTLTPSLGKEVVQVQIEAAYIDKEEGEIDECDDTEHEIPEDQIKMEISSGDIPKFLQGEEKMFQSTMRRFPMTFPIPPIPPPPAAPTARMTKGTVMDLKREEDLDSMLMSWYMCGYYTGLYEKGRELHKD